MITLEDWKSWDKRHNALIILDKKLIVALCCEWAWKVLPIFEEKWPDDDRPRKAILAAEEYLAGNTNAAYITDAYIADAYIADAAYYAAAYAIICGCEWTYETYKNALGPDFNIQLSETSIGLLKTIKENKDYGLCPILADSMEDYGCSDTSILEHLRITNVFTRVDWVLRQL